MLWIIIILYIYEVRMSAILSWKVWLWLLFGIISLSQSLPSLENQTHEEVKQLIGECHTLFIKKLSN